MIRLSIITVYKGSGEDLNKTEESVLGEFGSSDEVEYIQKEWTSAAVLTEEKCSSCEGRLLRRKIVGKDVGVFDGMHQALEMATGEWVLFLNAGDWLAVGMASRFWAAIQENTEPGFLYFDGMTVDCQDGRQFLRESPDNLRLEDFYHRAPILHPCLIVRRSILTRYRFDLALDLAADFDLMVRLVHDENSSKRVPVVGAYVLSGGLSERRRVRARWQATCSLWKHRQTLSKGMRIICALIRFFVLHFLITGVIHRMPALRRWLHQRRRGNRSVT